MMVCIFGRIPHLFLTFQVGAVLTTWLAELVVDKISRV